MVSDQAMFKVDYEDIGGEVEQRDCGETKPSDEHDRTTARIGRISCEHIDGLLDNQSKQGSASRQPSSMRGRGR